jgi:hypothetical protein
LTFYIEGDDLEKKVGKLEREVKNLQREVAELKKNIIYSWAFVARDPWPNGDVGDGVVVGDEFVLGEPAVEHAVEPMRLLEIAPFRVGCLTLIVFHKVMDLAEHRAGSTHLPISHSSTR